MNKSIEEENKASQPNHSDKQRGISVVELLFAASTIGAAVLVMATSGPKLPPTKSD